MNKKRLLELTEELISLNQKAHTRYLEARETKEKGDFFTEVKPFADHIKEIGDEWEILAVEWLNDVSRKNIHPRQITHTNENLQMVSIQAFFPETSWNRFKSHIQSIDYVLNQLYNELQS
ncbi:YppE family protein [Falsibacillus pallidus]|uniref:YppE family protein n=1 Tax=Falsibacillus pallidus TaxID=493781 RepID=UPI003D979C6F